VRQKADPTQRWPGNVHSGGFGVTDSLVADSLVADSLVADRLVADSLVAGRLVADSLVADRLGGKHCAV